MPTPTNDDLLCHKHTSARRIKVLSVERIILGRGRRRVADHGVRDPGMLSGRRVRLYERDGTALQAGLRCGARSHDTNGVALRSTSRRNASVVLSFGVSKVGGVRRGIDLRSSTIDLTARVSTHKSVIRSSNEHHVASCISLRECFESVVSIFLISIGK